MDRSRAGTPLDRAVDTRSNRAAGAGRSPCFSDGFAPWPVANRVMAAASGCRVPSSTLLQPLTESRFNRVDLHGARTHLVQIGESFFLQTRSQIRRRVLDV